MKKVNALLLAILLMLAPCLAHASEYDLSEDEKNISKRSPLNGNGRLAQMKRGIIGLVVCLAICMGIFQMWTGK